MNAVKAVPVLQARIQQGASFAGIMQEADRMANAGYARLDMSDIKAAAEFQMKIGNLPGFCENHERGSTLGDTELIQYIGVEPFKRQNAVRIRALQAEAAHSGTPRTVSTSAYREATVAALRAMPFEDGESIMRLLQRGTKISTYEACTMGVKLLRTGMTLPQPYLDTFIVYSVTHRATPDPAPAARPERRIESPGPHLGI